MRDDDDIPRPTPTHRIGDPLDDLSLSELDDRITALKVEIARLEAMKTKKEDALSKAGSFFKS